MNITLVYSEKEKDRANTVKTTLRNYKYSFELFPIKSGEGCGDNLETQINPARTLILSKLAGPCFYFIAGYSSALFLPFPVYGEEAIRAIPPGFAACFTLLKNESDLLEYFKGEYELYEKSEAEKGAQEARKTLLEMGVPVSADSMANCAAEGCSHEITLFLAAGFSPDTINKKGIPVLNACARSGSRETLRLLVSIDAQLNQLSQDRGNTALLDAIMGKFSGITKDLIRAGADVNIPNKSGQTALIVAVGIDDAEIVEALLNAGADQEHRDSMGMNARQYAALFNKKHLLPLFDKKSASEVK